MQETQPASKSSHFSSKANFAITACIHCLFPPLCLCCQEDTGHFRNLFCVACLELLELIDVQDRCKRCFSLLSDEKERCKRCQARPPIFKRLAAACEYRGPAGAIVRQLKTGRYPALAKEAAAFMVLQLVELDWPLPDLIIPVPLSFGHKIKRGYNQSLLIAKEIGQMIERPVVETLKRKAGGFSQTGLTREQRDQLSADDFIWKKRIDLSDQTILIVDDVLTTGTTLRHCAERLQEAFPAALYGLAFCAG